MEPTVFSVVQFSESVSHERGNKITSTKLKVSVKLIKTNQVDIVTYFTCSSSERMAQLIVRSPYNIEFLGSSPLHEILKNSFLLVYDDICHSQ